MQSTLDQFIANNPDFNAVEMDELRLHRSPRGLDPVLDSSGLLLSSNTAIIPQLVIMVELILDAKNVYYSAIAHDGPWLKNGVEI